MMTQILDGSVFSFCEFAIPVFLLIRKISIFKFNGCPATGDG